LPFKDIPDCPSLFCGHQNDRLVILPDPPYPVKLGGEETLKTLKNPS
jgi:hypothetical protein